MLPEIMGKWYTSKPVSDTENIMHTPTSSMTQNGDQEVEEEDYTKLWCYCNEPSFQDMVCCENDKCTIKWFHFDCLRIRCLQRASGAILLVENFQSSAKENQVNKSLFSHHQQQMEKDLQVHNTPLLSIVLLVSFLLSDIKEIGIQGPR